jgi:transcription initiation factor TFIIF subunit alpha
VKEEPAAPVDPAEAAEFERLRQLKADKEAQRALDQSQIAPVIRTNEPKPKPNNNKKEKMTSFYGRNSDAQKKESKIHYEETWPWHLEDAEGKSGVWVGSYVAALSDIHVGLVIDGARFRMIPLERFYKFDEKPRFNTLSLEAAEKMMYEVKQIKRWAMKEKEDEQLEKEKNETRNFLRGPTRVKTESATSRMSRREEREDDFELDISGDEFQDDDETPGFEADDEDTKESKTRIRREQVSANTFGEGEEDKVEQEERERQLEKLKRKMMGKQTIKSLKKLEHTMDYADESESDDNNPFTDHEVSRTGPQECPTLRINPPARTPMRSPSRRTSAKKTKSPKRLSRAPPDPILKVTQRHPGSRKRSKRSKKASSSGLAHRI